LVLNELLEIPILYLSRYVIQHKADYYRLLQEARVKEAWEEWILFMLDGVEQTSQETIKMIHTINELMEITAKKIQEKLPKIYSKDLVEILFVHPYTKIEFLTDAKIVKTRKTASKYLNELCDVGILEVVQIKNSKFFINSALYNVLRQGL
jgi:Fic family protein